MKTEQRLSALKRLIDHPATPEAEKENALRRLGELKKKLRAPGFAENSSSVKGRASFGSRNLAVVKKSISEEWPIGWEGPREWIEHERAENHVTAEFIFNWKCPFCGEHVTKIVTEKEVHWKRRAEDPADKYLKDLVNGTINQLCGQCTERFQ